MNTPRIENPGLCVLVLDFGVKTELQSRLKAACQTDAASLQTVPEGKSDFPDQVGSTFDTTVHAVYVQASLNIARSRRFVDTVETLRILGAEHRVDETTGTNVDRNG